MYDDRIKFLYWLAIRVILLCMKYGKVRVCVRYNIR
jgi:hypothetical protein